MQQHQAIVRKREAHDTTQGGGSVNTGRDHRPKRARILNIEVDTLSKADLLQEFDRGVLVTPNADHLVLLQEDESFFRAYREADFVTIDSQIVLWASRFLNLAVPEKISGSDFLPAYCDYHRDNPNVRLFLLGGRDGVAAKAAERINSRAGRRLVVGAHSPSMNFVNDPTECDSAIEMINQSRANVLAVGLGAPKQELWIIRNRAKLPRIHSFMAIGATLDFEAGTLRRAPTWMQRSGLEWLHRLAHEPGRLWRRYLLRDTRFFWLVLRQRFGLYREPPFEEPTESSIATIVERY